MKFQIKHYQLPYDGVMPGARGHKKVVVPAGTKVYCIVHGTLIYWCTYLHEEDALRCLKGLEDTIKLGRSRDILVSWNFQSSIPKRVFRSAEYRT